MSILIAILVFAVLVIVHEFGHFIVAKRVGVRVQEFAIGFPPRLASFQRGETRYSINLLPLGGYVLMPGENGEMTDAQGNFDARSFSAQAAWKRAAILVAGVTMNFLLAIVIYTGIYATQGIAIPEIGYVQPGTPAQISGLQTGDRILTVNGKRVSDYVDALLAIQAVKFDNVHTANVPVHLVVQRGKQQIAIDTVARQKPPAGQGAIGIQFSGRSWPVPWWKTPRWALHAIRQNFTEEGQGIQGIIVGAVSPQNALSGPVGIVKVTGQAAQAGLLPLLGFMALLSWNLAVVNLLPIPGLDGGRLLILGIEVLRRGRRLAPEREVLINLVGMVFLLSLIAIITINDVSRIISSH